MRVAPSSANARRRWLPRMRSPFWLWPVLTQGPTLHHIRRDSRDGGGVDLAGPDPDHALEGLHEDLAVADLTGACGRQDRLDGRLYERLRARHLEPHLLAKLEHHGAAAIMLLQLQLASMPAHAADGDPGDPGAEQRFLDLRQPLGAHHSGDEFHDFPPG